MRTAAVWRRNSPSERPALACFTDTAGKRRFQPITRTYVQGSAAVVAVFSVADRASFTGVADWIAIAKDAAQNPVLCIVGNKTDKRDDRQVPEMEARALAVEHDAFYYETCAISGTGVEDVFMKVAHAVLTRMTVDGHAAVGGSGSAAAAAAAAAATYGGDGDTPGGPGAGTGAGFGASKAHAPRTSSSSTSAMSSSSNVSCWSALCGVMCCCCTWIAGSCCPGDDKKKSSKTP